MGENIGSKEAVGGGDKVGRVSLQDATRKKAGLFLNIRFICVLECLDLHNTVVRGTKYAVFNRDDSMVKLRSWGRVQRNI